MRFPKTNRLGNRAKKTARAGYLLDSRLEADLHALLTLRERAGEISELRVKPNVFLTKARVRMIPDFSAVEKGVLVFFEAKGFETEVWRLKRRLWKFYGPGPLEVWRSAGRGRIGLVETIWVNGDGDDGDTT